MSDILITGANGQLGNEFRVLAKAKPDFHFLFTDVEELDITDASAIHNFLQENPVNFVINCAAYTAVDRAESDLSNALLLNETAVENLTEACRAFDIHFLHISTDYVFDGTQNRPYTEKDPVCPVSVYGKTKSEGEKKALRYGKSSVIRTAWLYSSFGNNFLKTMLRLGSERSSIQVVDDQIGTPTYAADLARAVISLVLALGSGNPVHGIYHFSNEGVCSWYDFAVEIMEMGGYDCRVLPIPSAMYPTSVRRPSYSVLGKQKIKETLHLEIPHWKDGLRRCMQKIRS